MKRVLGAILMLLGAFCLYQFSARSMFHGRDLLGPTFETGLPFRTLGRDYPADALLAVGSFWGLLLGLGLILTAQEGAGRSAAGSGRRGGSVARLMFFNALMLLSSLLVTYVGRNAGPQDALVVGAFGAVALLQGGVGILLFILALFERPMGVLPLILGVPVYLFGLAIGTLAFLGGA